MTLSIGAVGFTAPDVSATADTQPIPKPATRQTPAEQMHELQHAGQSTVEIAHSLGLPVTLVMESLGIQVTAESTAIATGSLSITV